MKRAIVATAVVALMFSMAAPAQARARSEQCRYGHNVHAARQTIRCAVRIWPVQGGVHEAFHVARHESGFHCKARNPSSSAGGCFQVLDGTWRSWCHAYRSMRRRFDIHPCVKLNARHNILLAIRRAHHNWCPWKGASRYTSRCP